MKRVSCKAKGQSGFTLAETLLTVLILLLVSGIVATGVPVARNVYEKTIVAAIAQVMLSSAITALRDELGTAWKVEVAADGRSVTYFSADTGGQSKIMLADQTPIKIREYGLNANLNTKEDSYIRDDKAHSLVPDEASKLYVACDGISVKNNGIVSFSGIKVCRKLDNSVVASLATGVGAALPLDIRVISGDVTRLETLSVETP